ncbi:MAG TPA: hypothetical protein DEB25_04040 [Desulfobulbaceae bacterium]|nr:hypothetical protein [Desulfobulbaceae bacterium]
MPIPQQMGRGDKMGRGPYEKSGLLADSSLPPMKTTKREFMIPVYKETKKGGKIERTLIANDFTVDVELWYLPYGKKDDPGNSQQWFSVTKEMTLAKGGK